MFLPILGALVGGGMSAFGGSQQKKQRERDQMMNALDTRYSPWLAESKDAVTPAGSVVGSALGGAISGGLQGAQIENSLSAPEVQNYWESTPADGVKQIASKVGLAPGESAGAAEQWLAPGVAPWKVPNKSVQGMQPDLMQNSSQMQPLPTFTGGSYMGGSSRGRVDPWGERY